MEDVHQLKAVICAAQGILFLQKILGLDPMLEENQTNQ
jgi:hypothetical protein